MKRIIYSLFFALSINSGVYAQQLNPNIQQNPLNQNDFPLMCRTSNEHQKEFYKTHPEALKFVEEDQKALKIPVLKSSEPYTIPVVFHVFGTNFAGKTVTDALIIDALNKTNQDFQGLTADWNSVSTRFAPVKKAIDITFVLAKIDPNGYGTNGITYHSNASGFGNGSGYDSQIKTYAWDNYKYMNVYIMLDLYNDDDLYNSGVSWYPDSYMSNNNLARVVYNGRYLGTNASENFRRVLTHEFGHWLNLIHTFEGNCSMPNDEVTDTPPTKSNSGSCNTTVEKCSGYGIPNGENFMDYTECYKMFTAGQVDRMLEALENHPARNTIWQTSNLLATGVADVPIITLDSYTFIEAVPNDGSIETILKVKLLNGAKFTLSSGDFTSGVHYNVTSIPPGLSAKLTATSETTADLALTGNATSHANTNDVSNLKLSFLDGAVVGGVTSLGAKEFMVKVNFNDPYKIVYNKMFTDDSNMPVETITCNSTLNWTWFTLSVGNGIYGAYYNGGLRFESYQKGIVCNGSTTDITPLSEGTSIGASSNWNSGGAYPNEHWLKSDWYNKTAYIGIKFKNDQGQTLFGWIQCKVNSTGTEYQLLDFAYNENPTGEIKAGYKEGTGIISNFNSSYDELVSIYPNPNSGTFIVKLPEAVNTINVKIFNVSGQLLTDEMFSRVTEIPINVKLAPGVYTLQLVNEKIAVNKLFIVE